MILLFQMHMHHLRIKRDDSKDSFYEELEHVFSHFPHDHTETVLGDFNAKMGRQDIFKMTIGNEFT